MKPIRMLILLAVFWAAGSLLLAAESPQTQTPAAAANKPDASAQSGASAKADAKTDGKGDAKTDANAKTEAKEEGKQSDAAGKKSIAAQAEAALKAAAEADGSAAQEPPKSTADAKDDTQLPPSGSAGKGPSPQRFVPSEQVRADFDVSFPIDI